MYLSASKILTKINYSIFYLKFESEKASIYMSIKLYLVSIFKH